jgi:hypothetical protein
MYTCVLVGPRNRSEVEIDTPLLSCATFQSHEGEYPVNCSRTFYESVPNNPA